MTTRADSHVSEATLTSKPRKSLIAGLLAGMVRVAMFPLAVFAKSGSTAEHRRVRFQSCCEVPSMVPGQPGVQARSAYFTRMFPKCGTGFTTLLGTMFLYPQCEIGDNVLIGRSCTIGLVTIGNNVSLAHGVSLLSGRHHHGGRERNGTEPAPQVSRIHIGSGVWIGAQAVVMNDVGENSIIGAGSVVVNPIPANTVAVGNPARAIGTSSGHS